MARRNRIRARTRDQELTQELTDEYIAAKLAGAEDFKSVDLVSLSAIKKHNDTLEHI
jgi:type II secretory pathway predicted ATPase ExeA